MALKKPRIETFVGVDGQYYWRLKAVNGRVIAIGGEGYATKEGAANAVFTIVGIFQANYYEIVLAGESERS